MLWRMRAVRRIWTILALCSLAAWPNPAPAQIVVIPHSVNALALCGGDKLYAPGGHSAPGVIARSFAGRGAVLTFRTCQDSDGNTHYFVRKPRPNRNGICRVAEDEVFPGRAGDFVIADVLYDGTAKGWYFDLHGWTFRPPANWRAMDYRARHQSLALVTTSSAICPRTDDAHYIPVSGTDGMLKAFFKIWRTATASPGSFDRFFAKVPVQAETAFGSPDAVQTRSFLRDIVFKRHADVATVDCDMQEMGSEPGCAALVDIVSILFDVTDHGLIITGIRANPIP
jgi:hypothetical protein